MPDDSSAGADSPTEPSTGTAARPKQRTTEKLPGLAVAAAGLSVFDAVLAVACLALWLGDAQAALMVIQTLSGASILLGLSAIVVGSLIFNTNRRTGRTMPGAPWARAAIAAGLFLLAVTVMLPLISALSVLVGSGT